MKQKIKKAFESTIWWSGVVMVGLVLGISLQFVRAWTEPTEAPPGGNMGAPINTSSITQNKSGLLSAFGLMTSWFYKVPRPDLGESSALNSVLTLKDPTTGEAAWAAGTGGGGIYTRWGYDTCVGSDTKIYSGEGVIGWDGLGGYGSTICLDGSLEDMADRVGSTYRAPGGGHYWGDMVGHSPEGSGGDTTWFNMPCAVCAR